MKEIVVISGKGGVGKSSITASVAVLLNKSGIKVTAVDSDVDAPNLAIVLGTEITEFSSIQASEKASIDATKCDGCGGCIGACKADALVEVKGQMPTLIPFLCEGCGACALVCATSAISIGRVRNGRIGVAKTRYGFPIVSGQLDMGESSSGHIVTAVKAKGRALAEDTKSDVVLVDGPPGIGCPVVASIAGANYALVVTEPTPAARNSLDRMLSVLNHFMIPTSAIINRFNLNPSYAMEMAQWIQTNWAIPVAQMIPMDDNVPLSLSNRTPVVEYNLECEASKALRSLTDHIIEVVKGQPT